MVYPLTIMPIDNNTDNKKKSWLQIFFSVCAAAFGVQSRKNLDRDFNQSSILPFIVIGILFTVLFIGGVALVVQMVLP